MLSGRECLEYLANDLSIFLDSDEYTIDSYRRQLARLENDERYKCRIAIYSGGESTQQSLPGAAQFRPLIVDAMAVKNVMQLYRFEINWRIPFEDEDGAYNELEMEEVKDRILAWGNGKAATISGDTEHTLYGWVYNGCTQTQRIIRYATCTMTFASMRNIVSRNQQGLQSNLEAQLNA